MDAGQVLRTVRQMQGWSQRELASHLGCSTTALSDWESSRRPVRFADVDRLLSAAGLDLALVPRADDRPVQLVAHLHLSTTVRLYRSTGGRSSARYDHQVPMWRALAVLARSAEVVLSPVASLGVWLPGHVLVAPVPVAARRCPQASELAVPPGGLLEVTPVEHLALSGLVPVAVTDTAAVHVLAPGLLALQPEVAEWAPALRQVAALLDDDEQVSRDEAGRRAPSHRTAREDVEGEDMLHRPQYRTVQDLPRLTDSRSWRLGGPVSLAQWLSDRGLPQVRQG